MSMKNGLQDPVNKWIIAAEGDRARQREGHAAWPGRGACGDGQAVPLMGAGGGSAFRGRRVSGSCRMQGCP